MMDVAISIFALVAGGITMELFTNARTPFISAEEKSFGLSLEPRVVLEDFQPGNPS